MPAKTNKPPKRPGALDIQQSANDDPENPGNLAVEDDPEIVQDFTEFFGDGSESIKVQLYRLEPRYFQGERIDGFLRYLQPGDDYDDITQHYGGGLYQLRQIITAPGERTRWGIQKRFRVSGPPLVAAPTSTVAHPETIETAPEKTAAVQVGSDTRIEGIPIGGSDQEFAKTMERIALIRAAFPQPQELNGQILQLVISLIGKQNTGLDLTGISNALVALKEIMPAGGGESGTTVLDLLKEGIKAFSQYVETAGKQPGKHVGSGPAKPAQPPALPAPTNAQEPPKKPALEAKGASEGMSIKQVADRACRAIVSGYMSDPQQTADEVNQALEIMLPDIDDTTKPILATFKDKLKQAAINTLNAEYETEPEDRERFLLFFDEVFSKFVTVEQSKEVQSE